MSTSSARFLQKLKNFFFQAEDGIRDTSVTGVQTCALPICTRASSARQPTSSPSGTRRNRVCRSESLNHGEQGGEPCKPPWRNAPRLDLASAVAFVPCQIGRASCRERV